MPGINNVFNYSTTFLVSMGFEPQTVATIVLIVNCSNVAVTALSVMLMDWAGRRALLLGSSSVMAAAAIALTVALAIPGQSWSGGLVVAGVVMFVVAFGRPALSPAAPSRPRFHSLTVTSTLGWPPLSLALLRNRPWGARSSCARNVEEGEAHARPCPRPQSSQSQPIAWLLPSECMPPHTRALGASMAAMSNWVANFIMGQAFLPLADALGPFAFVPCIIVLLAGMAFVAFMVPETKGKSLEQIQRELQR